MVATLCPVSAPAHAATGINQQINFQGRLLTSTGAVVPDGTYNMRFKIYQDGDGVLGGGDETLKWTETRQNSASQGVTVKNGYFSLQLGSITAFGSNIDWNQDTLWLSMDVTTNGTDTGGSPTYNGEMSPFKRLSATPYALNASQLGGIAASGFIQSTTTPQTANIAVQSGADGDVSLLIKARAAQSADLLRIVDANNVRIMNIDAFGNAHIDQSLTVAKQMAVGDTTSSGETLRLVPVTAGTIGLTVTAFPGQTANLIQVLGTSSRSLVYDANGTLAVTQSQTNDTLQLSTTNTSGTQTNALLINRNGSGGTTTNGLNVTSAAGTLTNGLQLTQSGGTFSNGINLTGTFTNYIQAPNLVVNNSGQVTTGTWQGSTVAAQYGGTGQSSYTTGDLLYASGATTLSKLPDVATGSCLTSGGVGAAPAWGSCTSGNTLQTAYANGNTISTTGNDIGFTLNSSQNHTITTAAGATGSTTFSLADGSNASPPAQLVLVNNADTNQPLATGLKVTSAAGGITTALDASGSNITNALAIGAHAITGTNFSVTGAGAVTAVGVNSGTGQIQGSGGLSVTGATSLNTSGSNATNIGTGSNAGTITLGNASTGDLALNDPNWTITGAGLITTASNLAVNGGQITSTGTLTLDSTSTVIIPAADAFQSDDVTSTGALTLGTGSNGALNLNPNGTGDIVATLGNDSQFAVNATPTADTAQNSFKITLNPTITGSTATLQGLVVSQSDNANTGVYDTLLKVENLKTPETTTNGLFVEQNAASGTLSNAIQVTNTAGTVSNAINLTGTFTNYLQAPNFVVNNSGQITSGTWQGTAVAAQFGGTGQTTYTTGDLLYASGSTALSRLADVATGSCLISGGVGVAPSWGTCGGSGGLVAAPTSTAQNTITPTTASVVALTVNATSSTTAVAAILNQSQTADTLQVNTTNTTGTQTNGIIFNRNGSGGTTTNGLNITQTAGTLTNGLAFTGTIGTDINRGSGTLTIQGNGGVSILSSSGNITLGTSDTTGTLLVLDTKTSAGDPTEVDGAIYYNSNAGEFHCGQAGSWVPCIGGKLAANTAVSNSLTSLSAVAFTFASYTPTIPANYCVTGRVIRVTVNGDLVNSSGTTRSLTLSLRFGSTPISAAGTTGVVSASATGFWTFVYYITCTGAPSSTATIISQGWLGSGASSGVGSSTSTVDTTTAQTINIYGAVSGNLTSADVNQLIVEAL